MKAEKWKSTSTGIFNFMYFIKMGRYKNVIPNISCLLK